MMGRNNIEEGESSHKTSKSDNASGRPLRKARYLWQIKGKYHMKNSENEASKLFVADENKDRKCSPTEMENCASKCIKESPPTVQEESNDEALSQEANNRTLSESKVSEKTEIAERIRKPHMQLFETRLRKWQARQAAWCYFDNTVNSVMEEAEFLPLLQDRETVLGNFRRRRTQRKRLENRAVMMAIHSHGLQRTKVGGNVLPSASGDHTINEEVNSDHSQSEAIFNYSHCQSGIAKNNIENITNSESETFTEDSKDDVCVTKEQDSRSVSDSDISFKSVDSENEAFQSVHLSLPNNMEDESVSIMEHTDFMDKAVAVAIQKKGLSTFINMEHD